MSSSPPLFGTIHTRCVPVKVHDETMQCSFFASHELSMLLQLDAFSADFWIFLCSNGCMSCTWVCMCVCMCVCVCV